MTTPSSTDSTDSVETVTAEAADEITLDATEQTPVEILPELLDEDDLVDGADDAEAGSPSGIAAGAAAITALGLALTSLGGNWLGNVLMQRQQLIGQIITPNSAANEIIKQRYTAPWHKAAMVSMWFAVASMLVAATTLVAGDFLARRPMPVWVRALTWGALALGIIGVGVAAAMYFDVFTNTITVPTGG